MMPPVVLISIPLITNDTDHLLICLLVQESISVLKFPLSFYSLQGCSSFLVILFQKLLVIYEPEIVNRLFLVPVSYVTVLSSPVTSSLIV